VSSVSKYVINATGEKLERQSRESHVWYTPETKLENGEDLWLSVIKSVHGLKILYFLQEKPQSSFSKQS